MKVYELSIHKKNTEYVVCFTSERKLNKAVKEAKVDEDVLTLELTTFDVQVNRKTTLRLLNGEGGYATSLVNVWRWERPHAA